MTEVVPLIAAAAEVDRVLREERIAYCIIGGLAVYRWGEPRFTQDVDFSVLCPVGEVPVVLARLAGRLAPRFPDSEAFARQSFVYLARSAGGLPIDIALGASEYEHRCIGRATPVEFAPGTALVTCSAEDLVVQKMFAARPSDLVDVAGVLVRCAGKLDWKLIDRELGPLAETRDDVDILAELERIRRRAGS